MRNEPCECGAPSMNEEGKYKDCGIQNCGCAVSKCAYGCGTCFCWCHEPCDHIGRNSEWYCEICETDLKKPNA